MPFDIYIRRLFVRMMKYTVFDATVFNKFQQILLY